MKILTRDEFLKLDRPVLYCEYEPIIISEMRIKMESLKDDEGNFIDWFYIPTNTIESVSSEDYLDKLLKMEREGCSLPLDAEYGQRDGMYEHDQLFLVYEPSDIKKLIEALQTCL